MHDKIILYYKFTPVSNPDEVRKWQTILCAELGLNGRIIISEHGINGTLGGNVEALECYIESMESYKESDFSSIEYKWSDGQYGDFPKLSVKVRAELVTLGPDEEFDVFNKGIPLRPEQWHDYLEKNPDATVFDARNTYESRIGKFKGAITPEINSFRDIKPELEKLDKSKPLLTYCTGDIRCEYLSAYMKHKGFKEVYHLDGGIVKYGEKYKDDGFWQGKCYVFDRRVSLSFSGKSKDIATCDYCESKTSITDNCSIKSCNARYIHCTDCNSLLCPAHQSENSNTSRNKTQDTLEAASSL